tara:strand:- start:71 stop:817 length:747 start_codon:yes stop_codon:yes gene_type:complete
MTSKNIDTSQSTFYFFLIILIITIIKQYTMGSGSDITWSLIYLFTTLISQYVLNLFLTSDMCGSVQYLLAFYSTFIPWTVIFGTLQILLFLIPGWLRPFSNTFGYVAARLFGPEDVIKEIFKSPSEKSESAEALNHIYNDPSQIINELPTTKERLIERLTEMKKSGMIKDRITISEENKHIKDLLYILYLKDNVSYLIWYLLAGITVINISKGYLLNSTCEQNLAQMEEDYEDYLVEKAKESEEEDDT